MYYQELRSLYFDDVVAFLGRQNQDWVTIGILRLLCSSNRFCIALSQPTHITTLLSIVKQLVSNDNASGGSRASSVYIQVSRSLLNCELIHFVYIMALIIDQCF